MFSISSALFAVALAAVDPTAVRTQTAVRKGEVAAGHELEKPWTHADGYVESDPKPPKRNPQAFFADCSVGSGDFHVTATLTIDRLNTSAAAFSFNHRDYFGFEGGHGHIFITGPFFDDARGKKIGDPDAFITPGKPFIFQIIRKEDRLHVLIDDKTVYGQKVEVRSMGAPGFCPGRSTMRIHEFTVTGHLEPYRKPERKKPGKAFVDNITAHSLLKPLATWRTTTHVRLADGGLLTAAGRFAHISRDEGKTWTQHPIFADKDKMTFRNALLVCTSDGTVVLLFANDDEFVFAWDRAKNLPKPHCRRPTYAVRSLDNGKTWVDCQQLDDGYCGALNDAILTRDGTVVVTGQELLYDLGRHTTRPYYSSDNGKTWQKADKVDKDMPRGDHSGLIEATVTQLADGRIWMLLRSYHGFFYESFSADDGKTWSAPVPSHVTSTGSPGLLKRLASGKLMLMWNAIPNKGFKRREELSIAFSEDEGKTWTDPLVILRNPGARVSYPRLIERVPGEICFSVHQGNYSAMFLERDVLKPEAQAMFPVKQKGK
ncbi:MAG: exo-alpha-sialidase [Lentisphaerae bacterium]|jgi:sialidase-1|nr:exo-alpha-sialidase [Lentisphaerota bacterium]MBT4820677.1 exo-alpha-sialidase [Lentisphaerota bacterium]MBT5605816.1 exo-alpha-sialidase [Lentisphaerota bacterium]MBT7055619.1 exo-alpha-sialidase [Lentisphaerota bacterium]MBT7846681.1 exo-alpha-sialidase [Lentisphaerota bacterium]